MHWLTLAPIAGIAVGVAVAVALVAGGVLTVPVRRDTTDASAPFLEAWDRYRHSTFAVQSDFRRKKVADGGVLYSATELVQRPPDRIVRQFGSVDGVLDGHPLQCSTSGVGDFQCFRSDAQVPPYDDTVRQELDNFRSYFTPSQPGAAPLYRVIRAPDADDCFELFQDLRYPDPPYGHYAKLCFDAPTGALRYLERQLDLVIETTEAVSMNPTVLASDFSTDADPEFESRLGFDPAAELPEPPAPAGTSGTSGTSGTTPGTTPGTVPAAPEAAGDVPPTTLDPKDDPDRYTEFDDTPNDQLLRDGSALLSAGQNADRYTITALNRLWYGTLSINDPAWLDEQAQPRAILLPVVDEMLRQGLYPGPSGSDGGPAAPVGS